MKVGWRTSASHVNYERDDIMIPACRNLTSYDNFMSKRELGVSFRADDRSMFHYEMLDRTSTFFQRHGALYLDFRLNKKFQIYTNKDLFGDVDPRILTNSLLYIRLSLNETAISTQRRFSPFDSTSLDHGQAGIFQGARFNYILNSQYR